jgi:hypothetical protein
MVARLLDRNDSPNERTPSHQWAAHVLATWLAATFTLSINFLCPIRGLRDVYCISVLRNGGGMNVRFAEHDVNWEFDVPSYRVTFWKKPMVTSPLPEDVTEDQLMYTAYEYELTGCHNVREAMAWADENARAERSYTVYAVVDIGEKRAQIRLFGIDPTKHKGDQKLDWPGQVYA